MTTRKQMCEDSSEKTRQAMAGIAIGPAVQKIAVEVGSISLAKAGRNAMEKTINVFFFHLQCWPNRSSTGIYSGGLLSETKRKGKEKKKE